MKFFKKRILILTTILIFVFSLGFIFHFTYKNSIESNSGILTASANALSEQGKVDLSVRLKIPIINVNATVEYVGLNSDGSMDAPEGPASVGWYMLGPKPGEVGYSVIAGHSGWKDGIPAVFDDLYKLKIGDKVYVENNSGTTITFVVREIKKYDPESDASNVFVSTDGRSHLNLITCTGIWDEITKSRSERLVVFADRE